MARHNNVKIYDAFFRKKCVLFVAISVNARQYYYVDIIQREAGQLWITLKCRRFYYHAYFFIRNTWEDKKALQNIYTSYVLSFSLYSDTTLKL